MRVRIVAFEAEVLEAEGKEIAYRRVEAHGRQGARRARKLQAHLFEMVAVEVRVAEGMDELTPNRGSMAYARYVL